MWVYKSCREMQSDLKYKTFFMVGYYDPAGTWNFVGKYESRAYAERQVNYLNGGEGKPFDE